MIVLISRSSMIYVCYEDKVGLLPVQSSEDDASFVPSLSPLSLHTKHKRQRNYGIDDDDTRQMVECSQAR